MARGTQAFRSNRRVEMDDVGAHRHMHRQGDFPGRGRGYQAQVLMGKTLSNSRRPTAWPRPNPASAPQAMARFKNCRFPG